MNESLAVRSTVRLPSRIAYFLTDWMARLSIPPISLKWDSAPVTFRVLGLRAKPGIG